MNGYPPSRPTHNSVPNTENWVPNTEYRRYIPSSSRVESEGTYRRRRESSRVVVVVESRESLSRFFYKNFYKVEITHINFPYKLPRWRAHRYSGKFTACKEFVEKISCPSGCPNCIVQGHFIVKILSSNMKKSKPTVVGMMRWSSFETLGGDHFRWKPSSH